jgi:epoxyqueuosine reductase QueG
MNRIICESMDAISPAWGVGAFAALEDHLLPCGGINQIPDGAASVIAALFPYYAGEEATAGANVSRYAVPPDYHGIVLNRLNLAAQMLQSAYPAESFAVFADNSPLPEIETAALAGLGVIGENNLLISPGYGSWVFIGAIVTTLRLDAGQNTGLHRCTGCGRCVDACPAGILGRSHFDKTKCLSYITQSKGVLTPEQATLIKNSGCAWGCDICQLVCPMNNSVSITPMEEFKANLRPKVKRGDDLEGRAYAWRGRTVIERNLAILNG